MRTRLNPTGQLLVMYTFAGDSNLDGQVDVTDLSALATSWQTISDWTGGDFDYSGFVDVADLGLLASNWQAGVSIAKAHGVAVGLGRSAERAGDAAAHRP